MKPHCNNRFGTCPICNDAARLAQEYMDQKLRLFQERHGHRRQIDALIGDIVDYIARGLYHAADATMDALFKYVEANR